jgi:cobalt-zinc-cadmium efflux system membrane fusion protein
MQSLTLTLILVAALTLSACSDQPGEHAPHDEAAAEHGHDHGAGGEKLTHFTDHTELFVEFPQLVVGETSAFAAHLTTLADFRALGAGKVTVRLGGDGQPEEVFSVDGPSQPGIFRPEATPKYAGMRELSIEVVTAQFSVTHALGPVTVFSDRHSAEAEPVADDEAGIGFTKEQQWKVDFATTEVVVRPIRAAIGVTGTLRAAPDGEALLTAVATGRVQPAGDFPRLGQAVTKGQVLAYLLPRLDGDSDLATLRAAAGKAEVESGLADRELARVEQLYQAEAVPEKRLLAARAAAELARAELAAAQQRLGQFGGASGGIPLRAPLSGALADVRVSSGSYVQEGALLFHIVDRRKLWLELRVPESEAARLAAPSGAAFRVTGLEQGIAIVPGGNGRLVAVGGVVDAATRTLPVVFEFTPPAGPPLPIGMAVQAQIFVDAAQEAVAVPASSVLDEGGVAVVYVQSGGESFERRLVRLGAREGDWVAVVDGLSVGPRVVSRGAYLVKLASSNTGAIGHGHAH